MVIQSSSSRRTPREPATPKAFGVALPGRTGGQRSVAPEFLVPLLAALEFGGGLVQAHLLVNIGDVPAGEIGQGFGLGFAALD